MHIIIMWMYIMQRVKQSGLNPLIVIILGKMYNM